MSGNNVRWRNRPQSTSMSAASCIFIAAGLNLALGVGWNPADNQGISLQFYYSWFIGMILGAIIAAPLITILQKHIYFKISALLVIASGIISISVPYNEDALIAARYINGIASGFATVPFLIHASEVSVKSYRGTCLTIEQYSLALGIFIQVIIASQWSYNTNFSSQRVLGIIELVFGLLAFGSTFFMIESPIFYLRKGDDSAALECLRRLQRPDIVTDVMRASLEEQKLYVLQNVNLGFQESFAVGWIPMLKLSLYRGLVALSFSVPLTYAIEYSSLVSMRQVNSWPPILYGTTRLLGTLIMYRCLDIFGRKLLSKISLLISAGLIIAIGCIFADPLNIYNTHSMTIVVSLLLLYQLFAGMFVPSSSVYLGEAFPLLPKPYMIAFTLVVENAIQIVIISLATTFSANLEYAYAISTGVISVCLCLFFAVTLPETRKTTLQEAQAKNERIINLEIY